MNIHRKNIYEKLVAFLDGRVTKTEIYEWALSMAVSPAYEEISKSDELSSKTLQAMIDINHDDIQSIPTAKALDYYRRCLSGEIPYRPLEEVEEFKPKKEKKTSSRPRPAKTEKPKASRPMRLSPSVDPSVVYAYIAKVYVFTFAVCSLAYQVFTILNPEFLMLDENMPTRLENFFDSLPHILYAALILLPRGMTARNLLFFPVLLILIAGMGFYWYISFIFIRNLSLHGMFILAILPFSALPATLAVFLFLDKRKRLKKAQEVPSLNL